MTERDLDAPILMGKPDKPLNGTVFEGEAFPDAPQPQERPAAKPDIEGTVLPESPAADPAPTVCPKCQYPLRPDSVKCPNCSFVLKPAAVKPTPAPEAADRPAFTHQPTVGAAQAFSKPAPAFAGTVNPMLQRIIPEFALKLQPRDGEHLAKDKVEFEGESTVLNRANLDENNNSITSREQAVITCEDGKWYIEDRSAYKTTFVQASRKTEIKDGDTILMGNRLFTFCDGLKEQ